MFKQVLVVRQSLKMGKGKIAAQCSHAAIGAYVATPTLNKLIWSSTGATKIALKATDEQFDAILEKLRDDHTDLPYHLVIDEGRTQIPKGSQTVIGIGPAMCDSIDSITGALKLL